MSTSTDDCIFCRIARGEIPARKLYEDGEVDAVIPRDMFDAIAQIVLWAQKARGDGVAAEPVDLEGME